MNTLEGKQHTVVDSLEEGAWFCLRSQPKREHIAAAYLSGKDGVEVFNPRLRKRQVTRRGLVWVTESLFPTYLFARFDLHQMLDAVRYTPAVKQVVSFGDGYPVVPTLVIEELQREFGDTQLALVPDELMPGSTVTLTDRAFSGLQGVVLRNLPARGRVQVLVEMLGRATKVEVARHLVVLEHTPG